MAFLPPSSGGVYDADTISLFLQVKAEEVEQAAQSVNTLRDQYKKLGESMDVTKEKSQGMGRAALEAGRALQDFSQGGIGGILNNIEGLAISLGGGAGLAGIMTAVGLAFYFARPHVTAFMNALSGEGNNPIPGAVDHLKGLNAELETNKKRLEELEKQQTLTNNELFEYNSRTQKQIDLEKQLGEEREKKAARDKLDKLGVTPDERERERAEILQASVGGDQAGLVAELQGQAGGRADALLKQLRAMPEGDPRRLAMVRQIDRLMNMAQKGQRGQQATQDLVAGAVIGGSEDALNEILSILPQGSRFRDALGAGTTAEMQAGDQSVIDAEDFGQRAHQAGVRRRQNAREYNERRRRMERNLERRTQEDIANDESLEQAARNSERNDERLHRQNDPSNQLRARQAALQDRIASESMRQGRDAGANPMQVQEIAREAADRLPLAGGNIAAAVRAAVMAVDAKYRAMMQEQAMEIWGMGQDLGGMMPQGPTQMRRVR